LPTFQSVCPSALIAQESQALRASARLAGKSLQAAVRDLHATVDGMRSSLLEARPASATAVADLPRAANENWGLMARNGHG
jgi:hypothetical protein